MSKSFRAIFKTDSIQWDDNNDGFAIEFLSSAKTLQQVLADAQVAMAHELQQAECTIVFTND
jgi:hypothetical protein